MTCHGKHRGHPILWDELTQVWRYRDNKKPTSGVHIDRPCSYCGRAAGRDEPDPCIGYLPGVSNACCGHGVPEEAYIQFNNGVTVRGALNFEKREDNDD